MAAEVYIRACAAYVPRLRVKKEEYARSLGAFAAPGVREKAVAEFDEDAVTMAVEAGRSALALRARDGGPGPGIGSLHLASTSLPYAEKVQASTVAEALGLGPWVFCAEHTTSPRAGTEALLSAASAVRSAAPAAETSAPDPARAGEALVIASEAPRFDPLDAGEHPRGAGAVAALLGQAGWARILGWRSIIRESLGIRFRPAAGGQLRDLGLSTYGRRMLEESVAQAVTGLATALDLDLAQMALVVLPQPDARTPLELASRLGIKPSQVEPGLIAGQWGDQGSAQPLLALAVACAAGSADTGSRVLIVSYGPGLAVDALLLEVTGPPAVTLQAPGPTYLDFGAYLRLYAGVARGE